MLHRSPAGFAPYVLLPIIQYLYPNSSGLFPSFPCCHLNVKGLALSTRYSQSWPCCTFFVYQSCESQEEVVSVQCFLFSWGCDLHLTSLGTMISDLFIHGQKAPFGFHISMDSLPDIRIAGICDDGNSLSPSLTRYNCCIKLLPFDWVLLYIKPVTSASFSMTGVHNSDMLSCLPYARPNLFDYSSYRQTVRINFGDLWFGILHSFLKYRNWVSEIEQHTVWFIRVTQVVDHQKVIVFEGEMLVKWGMFCCD